MAFEAAKALFVIAMCAVIMLRMGEWSTGGDWLRKATHETRWRRFKSRWK